MSCASALTISRESTFAEDNDSASSAAEVEPPPLLDSAQTRARTESFTEEFGRQFAERFKREAPPIIPTPRKLSKMELLESVYPEVIQYLEAGYSHEAIAAHFTRLGVPFSTSTLKSYVRRIRASRIAPPRQRVPSAPVQ
jgi:hypothetical protein